MKFYLALVHHPIKNKRGEIVTTSITNLDIHDISRSCRTFGLERYFLISPLEAQHELVNKILGHWGENKSLDYNPDRNEALSICELKNNVNDAIEEITKQEGQRPLIVTTGANFSSAHGNKEELFEKLKIDKKPCLLLFGTGWGLCDSIVESSDFRLDPIVGSSKDDYNHLSVRSAVAIYLDRLLGTPFK